MSTESRQSAIAPPVDPNTMDGSPGEITSTHKAIAQKALASAGLWDAFNEAKEQRRRALRDAGHDRAYANSEAWRESLDRFSQDTDAFHRIGSADFWRFQYAWLRRLLDTIEQPLLDEASARAAVNSALDDCEQLSGEVVPTRIRKIISECFSSFLL